ncbi:hypothetical protein FHS43_003288 [Streptosporangium becharense]|uniref:Uncharacterized protein n=1 Tax=Streptosporangium becharense TaxID=1816182 RepID=A0A7W9IDQ1_9ACTN|nr:hypothetical protein [Streptosporangium becharense]MBB5818555.1 hypothetical protein [Streptosporangium becharense]
MTKRVALERVIDLDIRFDVHRPSITRFDVHRPSITR